MTIPPAQIAAGNLALCLERMDSGSTLKQELLMDAAPLVQHARPLLDTVRLFDRLNIGYALIGGLAAMYYGRSRFTEDVDFVALTGHQEILAAHPQDMRDCHFDPACTFKLYHDSGVDVDLWKDEFADGIIARAGIARMADTQVRIADIHDLIAMKLRAGRIQDDYDISEILKRSVVDEQLVNDRVTSAQMTRFIDIKRRSNSETENAS